MVLLLSCTEKSKDNLEPFRLSEVRILDGPFYRAQQADLNYILAMDPDRLLAPYLKDAGIEPLQENYGNWENSGLDGHIGGHYLSAMAFMYASTGNEELMRRIEYMIDWLARCQEKNGNGYVGGIPGGQETWEKIRNGSIEARGFDLEGQWVPLYNIHKLFAGLRDVCLNTGNGKALNIYVGLANFFRDMIAGLTDEQVQEMLQSEHGGLNEVFVDLADITGDSNYLDLADRYSHRLILDPLLQQKNELTGLHVNTQIPKVIGYKRFAQAAGNEEWSRAADFFWNTVVDEWTISIGGNSVREHFHPADDFSGMVSDVQGPETCNTYNMLRLTKLLFLDRPESKYIEYYERALFNHILSSEHPDKGGFVYFTPMRPGHYRVYSRPQLCFWCCVGSGLENHARYGEMIYAHQENSLYVNLYIASELSWKEKGIRVIQQTGFPYEESTELVIQADKPEKFTLNIRYPRWAGANQFKIEVNGKPQEITPGESTFVPVTRKWKSGDRVRVSLPMQTSIEYLPDDSPWISIIHGPIVLAAISDSSNLEGIWADDSRWGHVARGPRYPVDETPVIVMPDSNLVSHIQPVEGKPLTFKMPDLIFPDSCRDLILKPFFDVHEARYIVCWPVRTLEELGQEKTE